MHSGQRLLFGVDFNGNEDVFVFLIIFFIVFSSSEGKSSQCSSLDSEIPAKPPVTLNPNDHPLLHTGNSY